MSDGGAYLDAFVSILDQIGELLGLGRERYDADLSVRLAIQPCLSDWRTTGIAQPDLVALSTA